MLPADTNHFNKIIGKIAIANSVYSETDEFMPSCLPTDRDRCRGALKLHNLDRLAGLADQLGDEPPRFDYLRGIAAVPLASGEIEFRCE